MKWLWRPNDIKELVGLKFPDIVLQVRKNPEKTLPRKPVPTGNRIRGQLRDRRERYRLIHSDGHFHL